MAKAKDFPDAVMIPLHLTQMGDYKRVPKSRRQKAEIDVLSR